MISWLEAVKENNNKENDFVELSRFKDITPRFIPPFYFITRRTSISSTPLIAFSNLPSWTRKGKQFYAAHSNQ